MFHHWVRPIKANQQSRIFHIYLYTTPHLRHTGDTHAGTHGSVGKWDTVSCVPHVLPVPSGVNGIVASYSPNR